MSSRPFNRKSWIIAALRRASYRFPPRYTASAKARVARGLYVCYKCKGEFRLKDTQMDHIVPIVGPEGFVDWNQYVEGMFPDEEGWGRICIPCHEAKTNEENSIRREKKALTKVKKKGKV